MIDNSASKQPQHVAIIMDGNGRWAQKRSLTRPLGHKQGAKAVETAIKSALKHKIETLSLFAFSTENWGRPQSEVQQLWTLLAQSIDRNIEQLTAQNIKVTFIGDLISLGDDLQTKLSDTERTTASNTGLNLVIAINYSGRMDILQASKKMLAENSDTSYDGFSKHLMTAQFGDVDLLIRTGGEKRLSNFMLWQSAYAELYFTDCKWPDFSDQGFVKALEFYAGCDRRFGTLSKEANYA